MSVSASTLRQLHRLHRQLADVRSRLARGPKQIHASQQHVAQLEHGLAEAKERVVKTRMAADHKELQLREREDRIREMKRRLISCQTNREYQTLLEQIAADEQANSVLSDEILELWDRTSEHQEAVAGAAGELAKGRQALESLRQRVAGEKDTLESELARLTGELIQAEQQLAPDFKADYDRVIKARGEDGLAPLDGEVCGACHQMLTPQSLNELLLGKPMFCMSCGSILYLPENRDPAG